MERTWRKLKKWKDDNSAWNELISQKWEDNASEFVNKNITETDLSKNDLNEINQLINSMAK